MTIKEYNLYKLDNILFSYSHVLRFFGEMSVPLRDEHFNYYVLTNKEFQVGQRIFYVSKESERVCRPKAFFIRVIGITKVNILYDKTIKNLPRKSKMKVTYPWVFPTSKFIHSIEGGNLGRSLVSQCIELGLG